MSDSTGSRKVEIPSDMRAFNKAVIDEHRANGGKLSGPMEGRTVLLLTTTGRRSAEQRTIVLGYGRQGDRLVVIASNNGAQSDPAWYHNLLADPNATVELGPEKFKVRATTAGPEERDELGKVVPYLESQQKRTQREIPIVILERQPPPALRADSP
jgi:deazaflavin-dependent oxidoreductase (nitroreductase family)